MIEDGVEVRLILADGTVLNNCECGYSNNTLWCFLKDISFSDAFMYFENEDKFNTVIFDIGFQDAFYDRITYSGFTELITIQKDPDGKVNVRIIGQEIKIEEERIYKDPPENENSMETQAI